MNKGVESMTNLALGDFFLGKTKADSFKYCRENNVDFRVTQENDVPYMITDDLHLDRLNFHIKDNIITKVYTG